MFPKIDREITDNFKAIKIRSLVIVSLQWGFECSHTCSNQSSINTELVL